MTERTVHVSITGRVQGVGFRAWTEDAAAALGLRGWVRNRRDGSVEAVFSGSTEAVGEILERCLSGPRTARVDNIVATDRPAGDDLPHRFEFRSTI